MAITVIRRRKAEFLTKIERNKCNNTQNIVIDGCYLLFEEYLQEKKTIYLYPESVPRNAEEVSLLRTLRYFE